MEFLMHTMVWTLVAFLFQGLPIGDGQHTSWDSNDFPEVILLPSFRDTPNLTEVEVGETARLQCAIDNLGTKKVTWRRNESGVPLTIEKKVFPRDARLSVDHVYPDAHWDLIINQTTLSDEGLYVCQISTSTQLNRSEYFVYLKVRENSLLNHGPKRHDHSHNKHHERKTGIRISGNSIVDKNKQLTLTCDATVGRDSLADAVDWFINDQKVATDPSRGLSIKMKYQFSEQTITSTLTIKSAQLSDAGDYICRTSALQVERIRVNVLNADTKNSKRGTEKNIHQDRYSPGNVNPRSSQDRFGRPEEKGSSDKNGCTGLLSAPSGLGFLTAAACLVSLLVNSCVIAQTRNNYMVT